ncbi:MAG TPA: M48 family metallopeptidase [Alphaproteobacteria bacterium]|nr:M48 family metallopeptidase [Alphaproteobacteria bacterium]
MCLHHGSSRRPEHQADRLVLGRRSMMVALVGVSGTVLVGCTGGVGLAESVPILVSPQQEQQLGVETWQRIQTETRPSDNRDMQRALDVVGSRLLAAAGENPSAWEMVVFEGEEANAFALPGGKIGVYEGIFRYMENDAQLATVVAHEIGHNQARHSAQRLSASTASNIGLQAVSAALSAGNIGYANEIAALLGAGVQYGVLLPYSRDQELEADRLGLVIMARAGYDPREALDFWANMSQSGPRPPEFASTHPAPGNRIAQIESLLPEAMALYTS